MADGTYICCLVLIFRVIQSLRIEMEVFVTQYKTVMCFIHVQWTNSWRQTDEPATVTRERRDCVLSLRAFSLKHMLLQSVVPFFFMNDDAWSSSHGGGWVGVPHNKISSGLPSHTHQTHASNRQGDLIHDHSCLCFGSLDFTQYYIIQKNIIEKGFSDWKLV